MKKLTKEPPKVYNCIVQTTGHFGLLNSNGDDIKHNRPTLTRQSQFIDQRLHRGDLKILARNLPKTCTDAEFEDVYHSSKGNAKLAAQAFCALFGQDTDGTPIEVETETTAQRKAREKAEKEAKKQADEAEAAEIERKAKEDEANKLKPQDPPFTNTTPPGVLGDKI